MGKEAPIATSVRIQDIIVIMEINMMVPKKIKK